MIYGASVSHVTEPELHVEKISFALSFDSSALCGSR